MTFRSRNNNQSTKCQWASNNHHQYTQNYWITRLLIHRSRVLSSKQSGTCRLITRGCVRRRDRVRWWWLLIKVECSDLFGKLRIRKYKKRRSSWGEWNKICNRNWYPTHSAVSTYPKTTTTVWIYSKITTKSNQNPRTRIIYHLYTNPKTQTLSNNHPPPLSSTTPPSCKSSTSLWNCSNQALTNRVNILFI